MIRFFYVVVFSVVLLLISCSTNDSVSSSKANTAFKSLPQVNELDNLSRTLSETFTVDGIDSEPAPLTSVTADKTTAAPLIILPGKNLDYAIYKFTLDTPNNYATKYTVTLNKAVNSWIGYSDYEYGAINDKKPGIWRWKSYTNSSPSLSLTYKDTTKPDTLISAKRNFYIAVVAYKTEVQVKSVQLVTKLDPAGSPPGDIATFSASSDRTDGVFLSWSKADKADGYYIYRDAQDNQIQKIDGADNLSFLDTSVPDLIEHDYWIKAYNTYGNSNLNTAKGKKIETAKSFDDWLIHNVDIDVDNTTGYNPSLTLVNNLFFATHNESQKGLKFDRAKIANPLAITDWEFGYIDPEAPNSSISKVIEFDGKPLVVYNKILPPTYKSRLYCAQASSATPTKPEDWTITMVDDQCHAVSGIGAVLLSNGTPCFVYSDLSDDKGDIYYNILTSKTPTGVADWTKIKAEKPDPTGNIDEVDTVILLQDNTPAICFHSQKPAKELWFGYPSDVIPNGTSTWTTLKVDTGDVGAFASMCLINNQPAISYYDATNKKVKFAQASAAKPTLTDTWNLITLPTTDEIGKETTSIINLGGKPAIAYLNQTNKSLQFAISDLAVPKLETDWKIYTVDPNQGGTASLCMMNVGGLPYITYGTMISPPYDESVLRFAQLK